MNLANQMVNYMPVVEAEAVGETVDLILNGQMPLLVVLVAVVPVVVIIVLQNLELLIAEVVAVVVLQHMPQTFQVMELQVALV